MNRTHLLATIASAAFVVHPAALEGREQFRETVSIDYDTHNPCTGQKIRIKGDVIVTGWYKDVEDGYKFVGETDYTGLVASSRSSQAVYRVAGSKDDRLRATVDIPVERLIKQDAVFSGNEDTFKASFTFRFSVSFFGDKDIDLTSVRTVCVTPGATDSPRQ
ncbi:MAG TPA: hypothetical protein VES20_09450 [Bryobacteraceae bacterium]|nr:hypothetical protein [Bryobacteraceae bacterium]